MTAVVEDALEALERRIFFEAFNTRYGELRADPTAWAQVEEERHREEGALRDSET